MQAVRNLPSRPHGARRKTPHSAWASDLARDPNNPDEFIKEYLPSIESLPPEQRQRLNSLREMEKKGLNPQWGELDLGAPGIDDDALGRTRTGPGLINPEHTPSGVRFGELDNHVSAATPVPGGVGPMTITCLLENTLLLAERRASS